MDAAPRAELTSRRTPNDISALCVELLRAVREHEFRTRHASGPAPSVDRAWRAWRADLDRYGPLQLIAAPNGLHLAGGGPPIGRGRLDDLADRLRARVLASVRFEPGLDAPTYAAFVSLLVAEPEVVESHGGAAGFLPERGVGIRLIGPDNDISPESSEEKPEEALSPEAAPLDAVNEVPLHLAQSLAYEEPGDVTVPMHPLESLQPQIDTPTNLGSANALLGTGSTTSARPSARAHGESDAPAPPREAAVTGALAALARVDDEATYGASVARAVTEAREYHEDGDAEACYRTILKLAEHGNPKSDISEAVRSSALGGLRELCNGRILLGVLDRATGGNPGESLAASQILMLLAEQTAPILLSAIDAEEEPGRREELLGIGIALGRQSTPVLHRAMEGNSPNRARIAARIAGEIRDERTVPTLSRLLDHKSSEVRGESARALARIGNEAALTTLKHGLGSAHDDVSTLCAYCLGVTGSDDAAQALTQTLRDARRARRTQLASAVIRSLGRLGREESVPELKRVIEKRSFFRRQEVRELKLQAIGALAKLPGARSRELLETIAGGSDMGLAVAARRALKDDETSA